MTLSERKPKWLACELALSRSTAFILR